MTTYSLDSWRYKKVSAKKLLVFIHRIHQGIAVSSAFLKLSLAETPCAISLSPLTLPQHILIHLPHGDWFTGDATPPVYGLMEPRQSADRRATAHTLVPLRRAMTRFRLLSWPVATAEITCASALVPSPVRAGPFRSVTMAGLLPLMLQEPPWVFTLRSCEARISVARTGEQRHTLSAWPPQTRRTTAWRLPPRLPCIDRAFP